jgi:hypothetical protein
LRVLAAAGPSFFLTAFGGMSERQRTGRNLARGATSHF